LVPEKRDHEDDDDKINHKEAVGELKGHPEEGPRTLTVAVEVAHNPEKIDGYGQNSVQADGQEIVDLGALEARPVEALEVKDQQVGRQEERKYDHILMERRDALGRVHRYEIDVKTKKVRIKIGEEDGHGIAEHKKPDETGTLLLDHRCPL
jgi:hypothetical protein